MDDAAAQNTFPVTAPGGATDETVLSMMDQCSFTEASHTGILLPKTELHRVIGHQAAVQALAQQAEANIAESTAAESKFLKCFAAGVCTMRVGDSSCSSRCASYSHPAVRPAHGSQTNDTDSALICLHTGTDSLTDSVGLSY